MEKILSIRLSPDGLSFWNDDLVNPVEWNTSGIKILSPITSIENKITIDPNKEISAFREQINNCLSGVQPDRKVVYVDTLKTILVPTEVYLVDKVSEYFKANNITLSKDEQIDISLPINNTVAIVASPRELMRTLGEHLGEFAVMSPLQYNIIRTPGGVKLKNNTDRKVMIYLAPNNIYLSVFSVTNRIIANLLYAETAPFSSTADILFYLNTLDSQYGFRKSPVYLKGEGSEEMVKAIRKYYRKAQCG